MDRPERADEPIDLAAVVIELSSSGTGADAVGAGAVAETARVIRGAEPDRLRVVENCSAMTQPAFPVS